MTEPEGPLRYAEPAVIERQPGGTIVALGQSYSSATSPVEQHMGRTSTIFISSELCRP